MVVQRGITAALPAAAAVLQAPEPMQQAEEVALEARAHPIPFQGRLLIMPPAAVVADIVQLVVREVLAAVATPEVREETQQVMDQAAAAEIVQARAVQEAVVL